MQRFAGNLANAAKGQGELADASRKYGFGIVDAAGKSLQFDAALRNVADRVLLDLFALAGTGERAAPEAPAGL